MSLAGTMSSTLSGLLIMSLLLFNPPSQAAGLITPSDGSLSPLEIRTHEVDVLIENGYAITTIEQRFHNPHAADLEATYSFPVPPHAAVAEFTTWIDGKPVIGEVVEKARAREIYESEKAAGREVGIAAKDSYKTFDIQFAPVRAGRDVRVRLVYLQSVNVDTGIGRYVYPLEDGGVDEHKLAFWTGNDKVLERFSFDLRLRSSYPLDAVRMPDLPGAVIQQEKGGDWLISLSNSVGETDDKVASTAPRPGSSSAGPAFSLDRDLVVYWRHQAGLPGSVDLMTHKPVADGRGTFMMVVTPGDDLAPITEGRDWVFVLDTSGSMRGKYATLADGVQRALGKLNPNDRFRIVLFDKSARELTPGYIAASASTVQQFSSRVANFQPGGGTNLFAGLRMGLDALESDRTSAIVLVTDGVANVGETRQREFIDMVRQHDVRLFTFIMGNSANRPLLEAMTDASGGFALAVSNSDDIVGHILTAVSKVTHAALHGATLTIDGVRTADLSPARIGSLYRGEQLILFGHYWGDGPANVELRGRISGDDKTYATRFDFPAMSTTHPEIERLWAYATIEQLQSDMADFGHKADLATAATDLALEYSLVTDHTSMVVLREEQFAAHGIDRTNLKRRTIETTARQQRAGQPAAVNRADTAQPMFNGSRASHGNGSGAVDGWMLLLLSPLLLVIRRETKRGYARR